MTGPALLADAVRRRFPGADVTVAPTPAGRLTLTVRAARLTRLPPADRQAAVYAALDRVPLDLLARVAAIDCPAP